MEIRILRYFLSVAEEENMTRAAEALHTTQSNLSRQLAQLENDVGKKLFVRGSRKITLTEEGMFLRKRAEEIIELSERTENELRLYNQAVSGVVHIGAIETCYMRKMASCFSSLREEHPQIRFDLFSGSIAEISDGLNKGLLDFGLVVAPIDMQKFDYLKLQQSDTFGLLIRKDSPLAKQKSISPKDIGNTPVWVAHQQLEGNVLSSWLKRDVSTLNIASTFNLITTPAMMVEEGYGVAFTFDKLVRTTKEGNLCFRPLEPKIEADLYLIWKKYQMFPKPAELFLEKVQETLNH